MRKTIFAICILIIAAVIFVYAQFNTLVKKAVVTYGPEITGTAVGLKGVRISVLSSQGSIEGLTIANPPGFSKSNALEVGEMHVEINAVTVLSDTIEIPRIVITSPHVLYEAGPRGTNLQTIADHALGAEKSEAKAEKADGGKSAGKKVVIGELIIRDAQATMALQGLGGAQVTLPEIRLTNIGKSSGGATFAEVAKIVLDTITKTTAKAAGSIDVQSIINDPGKAVKGVADELKKGLGSLLN